jgi:hypothetical protein
MQPPRPPVSRRLRLIEEAHSRDEAQAPLMDAKPEIVIYVNQDASRPGNDYAVAQFGIKQRRRSGGEHQMISHAHDHSSIRG